MKLKTVPLLLVCALITLSGPAWAEVVGRLTRVEGAVDIMPGGQLPAVAARDGSQVQKGDYVRTKSNARAEITFNDGSVVKVAQRSRIDVGEYSGAGRKLTLPRGKVQATVVPAAGSGARQSFEIRTPNAIAGVRGTSFYVYHQANVTGVAVLEGVVHTTSVASPSKGVTLVAGTATTVTKSKPPTPPRPVTQTEMNSHQSDVNPTAGSTAPSGAESDSTAPPAATSTTGTTTESSSAAASSVTESTTENSSGTATSTDSVSTGASAESTTSSAPSDTTSSASTGSTGSASTSTLSTLTTETLATATTTLSAPLQTTTGTTTATVQTTTTTTTTTTVVVPTTDATGTLPTPEPPPEPPKPLYTSLLRAGLMSRDATIDPDSNLLTIISDPGISPTLSGTTSLWSGSSAATLTGSYPTLPLAQPNHYWLGSFYSGSTTNDTTADGGAYVGYFGGMSLDASGKTETLLSGLYVDPTGKIGIMQGSLPGTVSAASTTSGSAMNGSGTLNLVAMTPISGINPADLAAGWWDPKTGGVVVEASGPVIADMGTTDGEDKGSPSEGFLFNAGFNFSGEMTDRGDVLRLGHFAADPTFGVWTRESFGSYGGTGSQFVLVTNAEWGVMNTDNIFNLNDAIRAVSIGNWQEGALSGKADGVWGNLASGSIRLLTGNLTGSANPGTSTFGAVTTGSFIDLNRFLANPSLAASLGFPTLSGASFGLTGKNSGGSVNLGTLTFYGRSAGDPIQLWVAPNITGSFSGTLGGQRYSLMNGADIAASTVMGEMYIGSVSATGTTWLGFMNAIGETGSSFRSDFDGIAAGSVSGTTFTGAAAGLSHPVTYFSRFEGDTAQLTRFLAGSVASYGRLDGFMAGMSLWGSGMDTPSDFKAVGFFTPNQALTSGDYVLSAPIISRDYPTGLAQTADGGAYNGHVIAGVNLYGGGFDPGISGVVNALYVDPSGNAGILTGDMYGFLDGMTNLWMADGEIFTVPLSSGGVTAANLNGAAGVTTISTSYGTGGTSFTGVPGIGGWAPGTLTRSFISSSPDWGIAHFGFYASYSAPPLDGSTWRLDFAISDGTLPSTALMGSMAGSPWDSASGVLQARTRGGFLDMKSAEAAATPATGIFIGETVGTFNPSTLQAMTSGVWMETGRFLALASTATGRGSLEKLNIPAVEVGKADFSGGNTDYSVQARDVRFFAPLSGGRPQLFATDNISGSYFVTNPTGTVTMSQVTSGTGYGVSGISPTFSIKQWDAGTGKWNASFNFNGTTGTVGGANNVQFSGAAAGRISSSTTFSGTAAGMVR